MAGMRQTVWIAVLLCGWLVGASAALAETVPLPTPAPAPKDRSAPAPAADPQSTDSTTQSTNQTSPPGITGFLDGLSSLNPFSGKSNHPTTDPSTFDAKQRALVNRVSAYLTSVQVLTGNFVQIGPDGRRATGHLFIQKPGKVRFEYDPPSPIDPPAGCRFHPRCPFAEDICGSKSPELGAWLERGSHVAACHMQDSGSGHSRAVA